MRSFLAMLRPLPRGNWGGFSFEIESLSGGSAGVALHYVATGAASRLRLKDAQLSGDAQAIATWQLGRLLV